MICEQPSGPPRIAVLMATFNGEPYLREQINTVLSQRDVIVHIFISDDDSSDRTASIAEEMRILNPGAITTSRHQLSSAKSAGANFIDLFAETEFSQFDFVALCDQDDVWRASKLRRAIDVLDRSGSDAYSSNLTAFRDDGLGSWAIRKSSKQRRLDHYFQGASAGCTYVFRAATIGPIQQRIRALRLPEELLISHDWLLYAAYRSAGLAWCHDEESHIFYRQHGSNVYGGRQGTAAIIAKIKLLRSGWYRRHAGWMAATFPLASADLGLRLTRYGWRDRIWCLAHAMEMRRGRKEAFALIGAMALGFF